MRSHLQETRLRLAEKGTAKTVYWFYIVIARFRRLGQRLGWVGVQDITALDISNAHHLCIAQHVNVMYHCNHPA